jgi:hypothetical protein
MDLFKAPTIGESQHANKNDYRSRHYQSVFQVHRVDNQALLPKTALTDRPRSFNGFWDRTGGRSVVLPYVFAEVIPSSF